MTLVMDGRPQRMMPPNAPPHPGHPTSTGTTVSWSSLVVVIQVLVVKSELVMSSVENPAGASVTVPVIGLIVVVSLVVWDTDWVTSWPSEMGLGSLVEPESDPGVESELGPVVVDVGSVVESESSPSDVVNLPLPLVVSESVGKSALPL